MLFGIIDFMSPQIDPIVARYADEFERAAPGRPWINSHAAKGFHVINWKREEPWYWFDKKSPGYPQSGFVGKYTLRGGNWTNVNDTTPLDVYIREIVEETAETELGWFVRKAACSKLHTAPFHDYLEIFPLSVHKNKNMLERFPQTKGTIYATASTFETTLDGDEVVALLKRKNPSFKLTQKNFTSEVKAISTESDVAIITSEQIRKGNMPRGAAGDDQKFIELLSERGYIKNPQIPLLPKVECHRMKTSPTLPFADRPERKFYYRDPMRGGPSDDIGIFG